MSAAIQDHRAIVVTSPLGKNVLLFKRMRGTEALGSLSEYHLDVLSEKSDIQIDAILGKTMSIELERPDGQTRQFNGFVTRFVMTGWQGRYASYQVTMRPWLWFLTRGANCRIFQGRTVLAILEEVFEKYSIANVDLSALSGTYPALPYCVQYRESDFNFVSRLMERFGIYYFFRHEGGHHTMVLADSYAAHKVTPGYAEARYMPVEEGEIRTNEAVYEWLMGGEIHATSYALNAFDFEKPAVPVQVKSSIVREYDQCAHEVYDYPGQYVERGAGEASAQVQVEALQSDYETVRARSSACAAIPGMLFSLTEHPRVDQNGEYLLVSAEYALASDAYESTPATPAAPLFDCGLTALAKRHAYRSPLRSRKPIVQGPQTAMVVGKAGEEIHTDQYGRVKVQFHWDRGDAAPEARSCWVRVSQAWSGKNWGHLSIPRIGQEVIVSFLEGDPDQPLVTGSVYNAQTMPPYALPRHASRSTIKTNSTMGGDGYNEIRFEDKKGEEQLFLRAERNQDNHVVRDALEWIGNNRHQMVEKDKLERVGGDKGVTVKGDLSEQVAGTTSMDAGRDVHIKAGAQCALEAGADVHIKAGMNLVLEAGVSLTLKAGGSFIVIGPGGVVMSGAPLLLPAGGAVGGVGGGAGAAPLQPALPDKADDGAQ